MKKISIFTPCFNEEENIVEIYERVKAQFDLLKDKYTYEHIFIDNASFDKTVELLRGIAAKDKNVKVIINAMNFGPVRSPIYGLKQCYGDAVIFMVADLQDPPELIPAFLEQWEAGHKVVVGVKNHSKENPIMYSIRKMFYKTLMKMSETRHITNYTGFGLYDKSFMDIVRKNDDPYPYFRGFVAEFGGDLGEVYYTQPKREHGHTKNNFYTLYDQAMQGFVNHSKLPLRLACFIGFGVAIASLIVAVVYFIYKLLYWDDFIVGTAPLVIGLFFFSAIQLIFIGIIGEYIGAIHTQVRKRPLVIEKERINFESEDSSENNKIS
ncbi:MAG: glycosyltransferase family 2 protein [Bacteroidales bacterium]|nr:glycosyltransferase family 2 protein [Bacteroidales bacterium]